MKRNLDAEMQDAVRRSIENVKQAKLSAGEFVLTELKLGLAFVELASRYRKERNMIAARRNFASAQEAYKAFLRFLAKATLTAPQREQVERDSLRLKESLDILRSRIKIES